MKSFLVALLALVAFASVNGAGLSRSGECSKCQVVVSYCDQYYNRYGLNLQGVLRSVGGLLRELLAVVGIVLNGVVDIVTGLLGGLLGGLFGGGNRVTLREFLAAPDSRGQWIDYMVRLCISYQAIVDKACPGLGPIWLQAVYTSLTITVSANPSLYSGCRMIKALRGQNLSEWLRKLKYEQCRSDFDACLQRNGGWNGLSGGRRVLFTAVNDILVGLGLLVQDVAGGLSITVAIATRGVLRIVLQAVGTIVTLLCNLLSGVDQALNQVLDGLFELVGSLQIIKSTEITTCRTQIVRTCGSYSKEQYSTVFSQ